MVKSKDIGFASVCCIIFSIGVALPLFLTSLISYLDTIDYVPVLCNITNVEYPTSLPTEETTSLWNRCDCGKRCISRYPCIKLYSNVNQNSIIRDSHGSNEDCTITEDSCTRSEDPLVVQQTIEHSINVALSYENSTVTCFVHEHDPEGNPIYLHQKDHFTQFVVFTTIFGIIFLVISAIGIYYLLDCERKIQERKQNQLKEKEVDLEKGEYIDIGTVCNPNPVYNV